MEIFQVETLLQMYRLKLLLCVCIPSINHSARFFLYQEEKSSTMKIFSSMWNFLQPMSGNFKVSTEYPPKKTWFWSLNHHKLFQKWKYPSDFPLCYFCDIFSNGHGGEESLQSKDWPFRALLRVNRACKQQKSCCTAERRRKENLHTFWSPLSILILELCLLLIHQHFGCLIFPFFLTNFWLVWV